MSRFGPRERAEFEAVRSLCYRGLGSTQLRERVADRLAPFLRADAFCLMELDPDLVLPIHGVTHGWSQEAYRVLAEQAILASPAADPPQMFRQGLRTVSAEHVVTDVETDPYFAFHLLPFGYGHELLTLCTARKPRALLTFTRKPQRGAFEARDIRLLDALAPHVAAGVHADSLRQSALADDSEVGMVTRDDDGRVVAANSAGLDWLRRGAGGNEWLASLDLVSRRLRPANDGDEPLALPSLLTRDQRSGDLYRLRAELVPQETEGVSHVVLIEPVREARDHQVLMRLGIGEREAMVAEAVLRGDSTADIAQALGCTVATVRVHLHHVYEKLGVSSRPQLAGRLLLGG